MNIKKRKFSQQMKKGFLEVRDKDHLYYYPKGFDGKMITYIRTKVSHGSEKDIYKGLVNKMANDLYFDNKQDFNKYLKCTKKHEEYLKQLIEKKKYQWKLTN